MSRDIVVSEAKCYDVVFQCVTSAGPVRNNFLQLLFVRKGNRLRPHFHNLNSNLELGRFT